jgi:hypothetical protein
MAVVVSTIAMVSCALGVAQHAQVIEQLVFSTSPAAWLDIVKSVPWLAITWTALFSTDLLLLIEVRPKALVPHCGIKSAAVCSKLFCLQQTNS